jgi:flagellar biosynthetic protein FliQ
MSIDQAITIVREALMVTLMLSAPILAIGLVIGLAVSIFQAVTQIQEQTLSFVPKIFGMAIVAIAIVPWAYVKIAEFARHMFAPGNF